MPQMSPMSWINIPLIMTIMMAYMISKNNTIYSNTGIKKYMYINILTWKW